MRALVADDDRVTAEILSRTLKRWEFDVTVVGNGAAAWDHLRAATAPTLAILDWMMPELDGPEVCRRVRRELPLANMYLMLLTARESRGDLVAGLDAGADDYITKPFDAEELRARVQVGVRVLTRSCRRRCPTSSSFADSCRSVRIASASAATISTGSSWKATSPNTPTRSSVMVSARPVMRQ